MINESLMHVLVCPVGSAIEAFQGFELDHY